MVETQSQALANMDFYFKGPVSALAFQENSDGSLRLLAGEGPLLTVYCLKTKQCLM